MTLPRKTRATQSGATKYPIYPGAVLRLKQPRKVVNPSAGFFYLDHYVYLWIHSVSQRPKRGQQPKKRAVGFVEKLVPVDESFKRHDMRAVKKTGRSAVQLEWVGRLLSRGYKRLDDVKWRGRQKRDSYIEFYKRIGLL